MATVLRQEQTALRSISRSCPLSPPMVHHVRESAACLIKSPEKVCKSTKAAGRLDGHALQGGDCWAKVAAPSIATGIHVSMDPPPPFGQVRSSISCVDGLSDTLKGQAGHFNADQPTWKLDYPGHLTAIARFPVINHTIQETFLLSDRKDTRPRTSTTRLVETA